MTRTTKKAMKNGERGAVIVHVAIALLALTAFSAVVVDYGIMWSSRAQAQNAADAGALSAAITLMNDPAALADARAGARKTASANAVWTVNTADTDILVDLPITCPPGTGGGVGCARVDVLRGATDRNNLQHTNYLPTSFANLLGITRQGAEATATAQVISGNAVSCIKPWIVADKWTDITADTDVGTYNGDHWDRDDDYDTAAGDSYTPTGFNPTFDTGYQMPLKPGNIGTWSSGWAMEIDFPGHSGSSDYSDNIEGCPSWVPIVGIYNPTAYHAAHPGDDCDATHDVAEPTMGCVSVKTGMSQGPTSASVNNLISKDSGATWIVGDDPSTVGVFEKGYVSSPCMNLGNCQEYGTNRPLSISPRIVPIAVFATSTFAGESCSGSGCVAQVVNLAGFFLEGMCDDVFATTPSWCGTTAEAKKTVIGRFMKYPGQFTGTAGPTVSAFTTTVRLVR